MNIFVGNLAFAAKEIDVQRAFMAFGVVTTVAIVMEKKGKKSRGFGFVEMPDEQEAQGAIAALNGKEILGRPINVVAALPKKPKIEVFGKKDEHFPALKRTGKYKEGRRTISYMKKRLGDGITASVPERRYKSNPMRWRKKPRSQARFAKPEGELKPWQKPQTESNPWKKPKTKSSSWKKVEGGFKPWQRPQGESKPWKKTEGVSSPWKKTASKSKPWKKAKSNTAKPWRASHKK